MWCSPKSDSKVSPYKIYMNVDPVLLYTME